MRETIFLSASLRELIDLFVFSVLSESFEMKNFLKDHRIFFLSCITALTLGGKWKINDKDSINSSFPDFLKTLKIIGAKIN